MANKKNKNKLAARSMKVFLYDNFAPTTKQRLLGNILRIYTMLGGKGAWRIALAICKTHKK